MSSFDQFCLCSACNNDIENPVITDNPLCDACKPKKKGVTARIKGELVAHVNQDSIGWYATLNFIPEDSISKMIKLFFTRVPDKQWGLRMVEAWPHEYPQLLNELQHEIDSLKNKG